jgi:hypothetical protein
VKEAIHIETGQYYACKVINKKLMEGREHMVRSNMWRIVILIDVGYDVAHRYGMK